MHILVHVLMHALLPALVHVLVHALIPPYPTNVLIVPNNKSRNIPEVVIVRRGAGGVLGIWEWWVNWVKGGANGVSLQAT